ncbi:N-acetyltransferase [Terrihabitans soli]|uniref:N-acetyltransferase n=1 Tax=Terrihabitans soli TaxID=708113 RepID=A0A6S6QNV1_9HYPH|nr:GNAT family N-acetyltransferase [Terrihabitans soli]BCJ89485.1 N-acetyltransferase [Terrihabitans soli]
MIRTAHLSDISAIATIYADAVKNGTASFELVPPSQDDIRARFEKTVAGGYPYLVAELDGRVAGYGYCGPYRPRAAYHFTVENSVYVDPAWHGKGVGRALMRALIASCEERGFRQMIAVIGDSRNAASIALHKTLGFEMIGTHRSVGRKHGVWLDTVEMQLSLGTGDHDDPSFEPA